MASIGWIPASSSTICVPSMAQPLPVFSYQLTSPCCLYTRHTPLHLHGHCLRSGLTISPGSVLSGLPYYQAYLCPSSHFNPASRMIFKNFLWLLVTLHREQRRVQTPRHSIQGLASRIWVYPPVRPRSLQPQSITYDSQGSTSLLPDIRASVRPRFIPRPGCLLTLWTGLIKLLCWPSSMSPAEWR